MRESPPTDGSAREGRSRTDTTTGTSGTSAPTVARDPVDAGQDAHDELTCPIWLVSASGATLGKCPIHLASRRSGDALAIRGLICERANKPGAFAIEEVLRWTPLAGSPAVGGVVHALVAAGVIVKAGTVRASRRSRRSAAVATWIGAQFVAGQPTLDGRP